MKERKKERNQPFKKAHKWTKGLQKATFGSLNQSMNTNRWERNQPVKKKTTDSPQTATFGSLNQSMNTNWWEWCHKVKPRIYMDIYSKDVLLFESSYKTPRTFLYYNNTTLICIRYLQWIKEWKYTLRKFRKMTINQV